MALLAKHYLRVCIRLHSEVTGESQQPEITVIRNDLTDMGYRVFLIRMNGDPVELKPLCAQIQFQHTKINKIKQSLEVKV